jgi:hypothetical protein
LKISYHFLISFVALKIQVYQRIEWMLLIQWTGQYKQINTIKYILLKGVIKLLKN